MPRRLWAMASTAAISWPTSSLRSTRMVWLRSPSAMRLAMPITWRSGRTISRLISSAARVPTSSASAAEPSMAPTLLCSTLTMAACCVA